MKIIVRFSIRNKPFSVQNTRLSAADFIGTLSEHYRNIIGTLSEHKRDLPERKKHPKTIRADSIPHIIELSKTRIGLLAADIPIL